MSFDERIERLTERHEALTRSVELIGHRMEELGRRNAEQSRTIDAMVIAIHKDSENIARLARIAEAHEHRPEEGGL